MTASGLFNYDGGLLGNLPNNFKKVSKGPAFSKRDQFVHIEMSGVLHLHGTFHGEGTQPVDVSSYTW